MKCLLKGKATPANDHSFPFAFSPSWPGRRAAFFALCHGAATANKWKWVSAEERSLSRGQSYRPPGVRPVSLARRRSTAAAPVLKGSFGFRLEPALDYLAWKAIRAPDGSAREIFRSNRWRRSRAQSLALRQTPSERQIPRCALCGSSRPRSDLPRDRRPRSPESGNW